MKSRGGFASAIAVFLVLTALVPAASGDVLISQPGSGAGETSSPKGVAVDGSSGRLYVADSGNSRVDVYGSDGSFEFAFGWGVADQASELQTCTTSCLKGIAGGGAGEFTALGDIAVDNDPASPSFHDVYVVDEGAPGFFNRPEQALRVEKFTPSGEFLLAWGGGTITGGATGTGDLSSGSKTVTSVETSSKAFEPGQEITGTGIPPETKITSIGAGTITVSNAATATGTNIALTVAKGPGNNPVNERQVITTDGSSLKYRLRFATTNPSASETETGDIAENAPASGLGSVQAALGGLPNVGAGNVSVTGPTGGPYVVEFKGPRFADTDVERLTQAGSPVEIETEQNGHSGAQICVAAIAGSCARGVEGDGEGEFSRQLHLSAGPGGSIYLVDSKQVGLESANNHSNRLQTFAPSAAFTSQLALPQSTNQVRAVAADSSGDFYVVTANDPIRKYDASGSLLNTLPGKNIGALTADAEHDVFSAEEDGQFPVIAEHNAAGEVLHRFGYGTLKSVPSGLARFHSTNGDVYATDGDVVRYLSLPAAGPIVPLEPCKATLLGNTSATLTAEVNPEGKATTTHFEYVDQKSFEEEGGFASPNTVTTAESPSIGSDFVLHAASVEVDLVPETIYHCQVVATDSEAHSVTGEEGTFETLPPFEVVSTSASHVDLESATLNTSVKPLGIPASGYFEYVDDAHFQTSEFATALKAPVGAELNFGAAKEEAKSVSVPISLLQPATRYHYRIHVNDSFFPEGKPGPTKTFRTPSLAGEVPDSRAYELVSPAQKNSAEVGVPSSAGGLSESGFERARIEAASNTGEAVTYTSFTAFGGASGAPGASQYLSKRTSGGWTTENITPFGVIDALVPPYVGFTPDLAFGAFRTAEPPLTADAVAGVQNLYRRDNSTGAVRALTTEVPETSGGETFCTGFSGLTPDGQHAAFAANGAFAGAPKAKKFSLYEWSATGGPSLLSVLPAGTPATPSESGVGARGGACAAGGKIVRHAISSDGSRIFWTYVPPSGEPELLARVGGANTIQLDAIQGAAAGPSGGGQFWTASTDGSEVLFTDPGALTPDSGSISGAQDLYRYDFAAPAGERLSDLTPGSLTPATEPAGVRGVLGAGENAADVYFAANGVLAAGASPGDCAGEGSNGSGACNLYLFREGEGVRFIATVSGKDDFDWRSRPLEQTARVSPDGDRLAFKSVLSPTGYDNVVEGASGCALEVEGKLGGDPRCAEAYLYDAEGGGVLSCASCNPSGARPTGPALLPTWSNPYEQPRYLSDDGSRLFFESLDSLGPNDSNGKLDVYEFERVGAGSCSPESPSFVEESGGCVYAVSSGESEDNSYLIDASSDGRDVFVSTRQGLLGIDDNGRYDVYDFRAGGGFPEAPPPPPPCEAEGCRPTVTPPVAGGAPGTGTFAGPGNVKPKNSKKHRKHHKHGKRSNHRRGADR